MNTLAKAFGIALIGVFGGVFGAAVGTFLGVMANLWAYDPTVPGELLVAQRTGAVLGAALAMVVAVAIYLRMKKHLPGGKEAEGP